MPTAATCKSLLQMTVLFIVLIGCCRIFNPPSLFAQVVGATVSGTVTDASGASSPGVTVAIKSLATQIVTNSCDKRRWLLYCAQPTCGRVSDHRRRPWICDPGT